MRQADIVGFEDEAKNEYFCKNYNKMIHLAIDPQTEVALKLIEFLKTQPFITVVNEPNADTLQAFEDARQGKLNEYNSSDELFEKLMKDAEI